MTVACIPGGESVVAVAKDVQLTWVRRIPVESQSNRPQNLPSFGCFYLSNNI